MSKLLGLLSAKTPALICGPPGFGKTRLLLELHRKLTADGVEAVYIRFMEPLHAFLLEIAGRLFLPSEHASSVALRGALWKSFESKPHVILLDDISEATLSYYRLFERILLAKGNTIVGTAVHSRAVGALHRVFWNQQTTVNLHPLSRRDANVLIEQAVSTFTPDLSAMPDLALRIAQAARGNPGRMVEMCIRAADPAYQAEDHHIRFGAVLMDSLTGLLHD